MKSVFEELDYQKTPLGDISLRRRSEPRLDGKIVYEVKLGDDFLMSSLFTDSETQLARLGLAGARGPPTWISSSADWVWAIQRLRSWKIRRSGHSWSSR